MREPRRAAAAVLAAALVACGGTRPDEPVYKCRVTCEGAPPTCGEICERVDEDSDMGGGGAEVP